MATELIIFFNLTNCKLNFLHTSVYSIYVSITTVLERTTAMSILKKGLNTFDIKVIGIILMVIDHIHEMFFYTVPSWVDWFGRPVATMFFFVSVIGFSHTRNKGKYLSRLYIGTVVMGVGSPLLSNLITHTGPMENFGLSNNIFRDLFLGVILMYGVDFIVEYRVNKHKADLWKGIGLLLLPILLAAPMLFMTMLPIPVILGYTTLVPSMFTAENSFLIYMIPLLYCFRNNRLIQSAVIAMSAMIGSLAFGTSQWLMILAIIPVLLYNGQKGPGMRNFFYLFYPVHIWILYAISCLVSSQWFS